MSINDKINPYHVLCGVAVGAVGSIVGLQLINVIRTRRRNAKQNKGKMKNRFKSEALYHSPGE